jgi:predicted dehydrogenase
MTKDINIGIIGTGFGKMIGLNFKALDPSVKVYFAGRNKEKTELTAKEVGADGTFDSWQELVDDPKIDLVVIASHSGAHKEMFHYAAKAGKNILVEKPASLHSSDVIEMEKLFSKSRKIAVVNHEGRFHPIISYIKEKIESGDLGDIMTVRFGAYTNWYSNSEYKENWNQDKSLGGGQIYSIGSHLIDLARYMLNFPKVTYGSVQDLIYQDPRFLKEATAESQFAAHFETDSKTSIQLYNDCYCFGYKDFIIEVVGSKGIITYSDIRGLKESFSNTETLKDVVWVDPIPEVTLGNSILTKSMKYMVRELIRSIRDNKVNEKFCSLDQEKENLELFERFIRK